ncbi:CamS family sex pheromone protein [Fictibacillus iocasae]|uniref:CamS family sex pheromone protein n=1 Tax=Fictibacillus iocasae TaxID=2715437 RepID=A0ABW2NSD4_9BACL
MMKKISLLFLTLLIVLTGCLNDNSLEKEEEVVKKKGKKEEKAIITGEIKTGENYYRSIFPFEPGGARGLIRYGVDNRLDINEFEMGLMRVAQEKFSTDKYFFQEGQYLTESTVNNWLKRDDGKKEKLESGEMSQRGMNPPLGMDENSTDVKAVLKANEDNPKYLSYVLEHNYLVQSGEGKVKLGGLVIGLSFNSTYYFKAEDKERKIHPGEKKLDKDKVKQEAAKIAEKVAERLRTQKGLEDVPMLIALYQEEERDAVVPGHFFAVGTVSKGSGSINDWDQIDEKYYLFPSGAASKNKRNDFESFTNFKTEIQKYFPNYIGVIGNGLYVDGELKRLTIQIPVQFRGKAEIISFTQFVTTRALEKLPDVPIEIYIQSAVEQPEALIVKNEGQEEPFVHIYRK